MALHTPHGSHLDPDPEDEDRPEGLLGRVVGRIAQGVRDTGSQLASGAGLIDRAMRFVGDNPLAMHPLTGPGIALGESVEAFQAGQPGLGLLAATGIGFPGARKAGLFARAELKALQRRFTKPIKEALDAGDTVEASRLTGLMAEARAGGFQLPTDEASRQARAAAQGFDRSVFHSTRRAGTPSEQLSQMGSDFEEFYGWTHVGTQKAARDRGDQIRRSMRGGGLPTLTDEKFEVFDAVTGSPVQHFDTEDAAVAFMDAQPKGSGVVLDFDPPGIREVADIGERTFPLRMRGRFLEVEEGHGWGPTDLLEQAETNGTITNAERFRIHDEVPRSGQHAAVEALFKEKGFDGIKYVNVVEDVGSTSFMVFDPANLRSATAARFDPANIGRASMTGVGAGLIAAASRQDEP